MWDKDHWNSWRAQLEWSSLEYRWILAKENANPLDKIKKLWAAESLQNKNKNLS